MSISTNLGVYLGFPCLHKRVSKSTYDTLIMKVRAKLAGWRMKSHSRAGRDVLIQYGITSIPAYAMQSACLPCGPINALERLSKGFLWGDTVEKQCMHLVSWTKVCQGQQDGGLGIRNLGDMNTIALARLCWCMISEPQLLWSWVLLAIYGGLQDLQRLKPCPVASHTWRSIHKG